MKQDRDNVKENAPLKHITSDLNTDIDFDQFLSMMLLESGIEIQQEWKESILSHVETAFKMAKIIYSAPISNQSLELSNTFQPGKKDPI